MEPNYTDKVNSAVKRLNEILPLSKGVASLAPDDILLYYKILRGYLEESRALSHDEMNMYVRNVRGSLSNIEAHKLITIDDNGCISGAYPFISEKREHQVSISGSKVNCMCALDSLAVSPMFDIPTKIDSQCYLTGEKIHIEQQGTNFQTAQTDTFFGIDWGAAASDISCAESLCMEMIFLKDNVIANNWLLLSPDTREIFELTTAVNFAADFFVPVTQICQRILTND